MNLQEATERIKVILNQEIAPNTLRKACATSRLKGVRKGEGSMHIRRTEWDVTEEDVIQFVLEEYHPRPSRRTKKHDGLHIPKPSSFTIKYRTLKMIGKQKTPLNQKYFTELLNTYFKNLCPFMARSLKNMIPE